MHYIRYTKRTVPYKKTANAPEMIANATAPSVLGAEIVIAPFLPAAALPLPVAAAALPEPDGFATKAYSD